MNLAINNLQRLICHKTHPTNQATRPLANTLLIRPMARKCLTESRSSLSFIKVLSIYLSLFTGGMSLPSNKVDFVHCVPTLDRITTL